MSVKIRPLPYPLVVMHRESLRALPRRDGGCARPWPPVAMGRSRRPLSTREIKAPRCLPQGPPRVLSGTRAPRGSSPGAVLRPTPGVPPAKPEPWLRRRKFRGGVPRVSDPRPIGVAGFPGPPVPTKPEDLAGEPESGAVTPPRCCLAACNSPLGDVSGIAPVGAALLVSVGCIP